MEKNKTKLKKAIFRRTRTLNGNSQNRGITLIALIVTIIVLLILAGVTISTLTGDNRIVNEGKRC